MEKIFRTKTGFCHVTEDQIILTRDGAIGSAAKVIAGNNISRILIIYGLLSCGLIYVAYKSYLKGHTFGTILFGILGLYLIIGIFRSLNNSTTPIIDRKDIKAIKFIKGTSGLTRSRFEIEFSEGGKIKKRLLFLPGSISGGQDETAKAVQLLRDEKLLN